MSSTRRTWATLDRVSFRIVMGMLCGISLLMLLAPTVIVLITSFTSSLSLRFPPPGYSTRWYVELLASDEIKSAAMNSLKVAAASTVVCVVLGVAAALALARRSAGWARAADALFLSPLILPQLAFGLSVLVYFSLVHVQLSLTTLIIGHVVVCAPFVLRTTTASLSQLDPALLESSASLGAGRFYTFTHVTLPSIRAGVLAGGFLAFMASFDNVPVSLFLADARTEMLPIRLWQMLESSLDVRAAAASGVLIALTLILMILMERVAGLSRQLR
jgi:putative spermidine/putrescine transport system permease protein